jgi:hypothetical protein
MVKEGGSKRKGGESGGDAGAPSVNGFSVLRVRMAQLPFVHVLYVKPHRSKKHDDGALPCERTLFVANGIVCCKRGHKKKIKKIYIFFYFYFQILQGSGDRGFKGSVRTRLPLCNGWDAKDRDFRGNRNCIRGLSRFTCAGFCVFYALLGGCSAGSGKKGLIWTDLGLSFASTHCRQSTCSREQSRPRASR